LGGGTLAIVTPAKIRIFSPLNYLSNESISLELAVKVIVLQ
jgi:hypothetical protein